jgi:hypothetical protein
MIRELGAALHNSDRSVFSRVFNTAILLAGGMSLITASIFGIIFLCLASGAVFNIEPPELISAAVAECHRQAGPRFIVGAGCEVPRDTPPENLRAMCEYARTHRP